MGSAAKQDSAGNNSATLSLGGAKVVVTTDGRVIVTGATFLQILETDPAKVVGPDGEPFALANQNTAAVSSVRFQPIEMSADDLRQWLTHQDRKKFDVAPNGTIYLGESADNPNEVLFLEGAYKGKGTWQWGMNFQQTMNGIVTRMPKRNELDKNIYCVKGAINEAISDFNKRNGANLELVKNKGVHWSSSEYNQSNAYVQHFDDGYRDDSSKDWAGGLVRSVRSLARER